MGDVFVAAACIAYYGAFTGPYRIELVNMWTARCQELGIPVTENVTLRATLAQPVEVRLLAQPRLGLQPKSSFLHCPDASNGVYSIPNVCKRCLGPRFGSRGI